MTEPVPPPGSPPPPPGHAAEPKSSSFFSRHSTGLIATAFVILGVGGSFIYFAVTGTG